MEIKVKIPDMRCEACVKRIENALREIKGVSNFKVELSTKSVWASGEFEEEELFKKLKDIGYSPKIED